MTALRYLAEGLTDKEIAGRVGIAKRTASKHIENVYASLGAHSRVEAVNIARREHLRPDDGSGPCPRRMTPRGFRDSAAPAHGLASGSSASGLVLGQGTGE